MDDARIQSIASGVYKTSGHVGFQAMGALDSRINPKDSQTVEVVSLDDFFKNKEVPTFIKMDIEGSEADALEGAKKLIEAHKPKLAIAVYHQASDLWRLPLLINALHNSYRLFLRHYTYEITDTVCYAL
jgi:hypothetical protein